MRRKSKNVTKVKLGRMVFTRSELELLTFLHIMIKILSVQM